LLIDGKNVSIYYKTQTILDNIAALQLFFSNYQEFILSGMWQVFVVATIT